MVPSAMSELQPNRGILRILSELRVCRSPSNRNGFLEWAEHVSLNGELVGGSHVFHTLNTLITDTSGLMAQVGPDGF